jgi:hypothetical protein
MREAGKSLTGDAMIRGRGAALLIVIEIRRKDSTYFRQYQISPTMTREKSQNVDCVPVGLDDFPPGAVAAVVMSHNTSS